METFIPKGNIRGFIMPDFIFNDTRLSLEAKTLYALFCNYAGERNYCWPSHKTLADKLKCSVSSVKTYIGQLINCNFVIKKTVGNHVRTCMYFPLKPICNVSSQNLATRQPESAYNSNLKEIKKNTPPISPKPTTAQSLLSRHVTQGGGRSFSSVNTDFEKFFVKYPRHDAKEQARLIWHSLNRKGLLPDVSVLLESINSALSTSTWQKDGGRFIPYAMNWLRGQRWVDPSLVPSLQTDAEPNDVQEQELFKKHQLRTKANEAMEQEHLNGLRPLFDTFASAFNGLGIAEIAFGTWAYLYQKGIKLTSKDIPENADNITLSTWLLQKRLYN